VDALWVEKAAKNNQKKNKQKTTQQNTNKTKIRGKPPIYRGFIFVFPFRLYIENAYFLTHLYCLSGYFSYKKWRLTIKHCRIRT
jgi:hypothetical protein